MNEAYKSHQVQFSRASVSRTKKKKWYRMAMGSAAEREAKTKLGKDQETHLNLYIAGIEGGVLGWATFPLELAGDPKMDGVVIVNTSLPGGDGVYNLGKTAVHECGHWLDCTTHFKAAVRHLAMKWMTPQQRQLLRREHARKTKTAIAAKQHLVRMISRTIWTMWMTHAWIILAKARVRGCVTKLRCTVRN